ncbi:hypothetical protein GUJ93_ZPchr0007g3767 [Zizania palustris]|uniref:Uncharacterized protein n=1 Tax=Zizania palustris TaxID=103762 RepID=A0A8J5TJR3_ZIZPA|nr:hypothetical protein GUJ93_ZPchr0007g3767 [Zizania palustris]
MLEDDSAGLLVRLEQGLDGDVQSARILIGLHGEVEDNVVDRAVHPATDAGVGLRPHGVIRARDPHAIDVAEQPVLGAEGGEERLLLGVVGALEAEGDRHVLLHVDGGVGGEDGRSKCIPQNARGLGAQDAGGGRGRRRDRHGGAAKAAVRLASRRRDWSRAAGWCGGAHPREGRTGRGGKKRKIGRRPIRDRKINLIPWWEMAPYIESIDSQEGSYFVVRSLCDILRIRWESTRSRTKQRALLMMENLVEDIGNDFPVAAQRVKLVFGVQMPTLPALRKEYGELLISCGIVGEALDIFKDLELWDNLIYCYRLLGKVADATSLITTRISVTPNDPRLWCSLGDVTNNDDHYKKALEVSNNKSARAMRSLARSAYNRNDFHASKILWESALALNSLFPDGWFAYGTVAWKDKDIQKAVDAFSRAVQIDPENGEGWNNIACLHMIREKSQAAVQAFKEAVKFKRNSWEVWENYSKVLLDTGNIRQTLEAVKMVLNLSSNKRFNVNLLEKVMDILEEQLTHLSDTQEAESVSSTSDDANEETRKSNQLLDIIGDILQQIVRSGGSNSEIWGLYARWHKTNGNLMACSEALLKQVRSLQGSGLWHDQTKFTKYAQASLQLCKVYMEISSSSGNRRELFSAEMHLKSSLKQASDFLDTPEYKALDSCFAEIKNLIGSS